ncbi:MAG: BMP family ABC transporter substrate-binding protein [Anaerolineae bacterium]|nr:BMP family ABC transporter substrate-binding protein [Anaerolineae bacterium]PKN99795.1 MAG: BMP family ABC transporter substrate-binding protein [Chloroflexi bacterium HGW-Chloroflexi-5]
MFSKRIWTLVSLLVVMALVLAACATPTAAPAVETEAPAEPFVIGILTVGPITDNGWSTANYLGAVYAQSKIEGAELIYAENVNSAANPNTTAAQFAEQLLDKGANVIIFNSDDMKDGVTEFTSLHPDVPVLWLTGDFAWEDGKRYQPDMKSQSDVFSKMEYGKMMAGCAAALTTKTGKIGFLGALINDETRRHAAAAYLGADYCWKSIRSETTPIDFKVTWIGMWFNIPGVTLDPTQVADTFFTDGYDIVISGIDSTEAVTVAKKFRDQGEDVYAVQYDYEKACDVAPDACLGVPYYNWGVDLLPIIQSIKDGTYTRQFVWSDPDWSDINNPDTSSIGFKKSDGLSAENSALLDQFIGELAGGLNLWTGPLNFQDGTEFLADGVEATDQQIWYLPQLLEGMTGDSVTK